MTQKTIKKEEPLESKNPLAKLQEKFEKIKKKGNYRKVRLRYSSCCGCGCYDVTIERTVPEDSDLKDGDWADDYMDGDVMVDDDDDDDE